MNRATLLFKLALFGIALSFLAPLSAHAQHLQPAGTKSGFVTTSDGVRTHYLEAGSRATARLFDRTVSGVGAAQLFFRLRSLDKSNHRYRDGRGH